jgi:hypothetical protein
MGGVLIEKRIGGGALEGDDWGKRILETVNLVHLQVLGFNL